MSVSKNGRSLLVLTTLFGATAVAAWAVRWAVGAGYLPSTPWTAGFSGTARAWTWAAAAGLGFVLALRGAALARRRAGQGPGRNLRQLQTLAAALLVLMLMAGLAGDVQGILVSVGLVGFGLTLALQRPILALAGWASIFFGGAFREGDRIQVGDLTGDVLSISLLSTRLWEVGEASGRSPGRPTGRIRTVSNAIFLEESVANATGDSSVVFDEFAVGVAYEGDLELAKKLLQQVAGDVLDLNQHERMARTYEALTRGMTMEAHFPKEPRILMSLEESWIELRLRYLVEARLASRVRTQLAESWQSATAPHAARLPLTYRKTQTQPIGPDGRPRP